MAIRRACTLIPNKDEGPSRRSRRPATPTYGEGPSPWLATDERPRLWSDVRDAAGMKRTPVLFGTVVLLCATLMGCSGPGDADAGKAGGVVSGPLLTSVGKSEDGMFATIAGRVSFDGRCLQLRRGPVVWPEGTAWEAPDLLTLPGGESVTVGERVEGAGGYLDLDAVRRAFGDDVASEARHCLGETGEVAVFNPGWEVSRVGQVALVARPRRCGFGVTRRHRSHTYAASARFVCGRSSGSTGGAPGAGRPGDTLTRCLRSRTWMHSRASVCSTPGSTGATDRVPCEDPWRTTKGRS